MSRLKRDTPVRDVTQVGKGDFVKVGSQWKEIESNPAEGASCSPRDWVVRTTDGGQYGMFGIHRYAKAEDIE
ncbi:MAG: hypothetical protein JWN38_161 [Candidatus Saccharibacteria bacterium]|nr:hypothetical protein [Candidatus Saccharibacteria bacterium]